GQAAPGGRLVVDPAAAAKGTGKEHLYTAGRWERLRLVRAPPVSHRPGAIKHLAQLLLILDHGGAVDLTHLHRGRRPSAAAARRRPAAPRRAMPGTMRADPPAVRQSGPGRRIGPTAPAPVPADPLPVARRLRT